MDKYKSLCILGRLPALGVAELEVLYGAEHVKPLSEAALLDVPAEEIDFKRLGGSVKTARILAELPGGYKAAIDYLQAKIPEHLTHIEGKLTLGVSFYGFGDDASKINRDLLAIKKTAKQSGKSIRIVPNKAASLNSAQVLHNKLTHKGGWELLLVADGAKTILAQTLFVQDIEAYAGRDQVRPKRDARVGMLPPKLAQTLVNLAAGHLKAAIEPGRVRLLDPFCGTGVILQEALLMGYSVMGTDIDPRMVDYTAQNLKWLVEKYPKIEGQVALEVADATNYTWPRFSVIAAETFLGRPLAALPEAGKLQEIIGDANVIITKFLSNLAPQLKPEQRLVLAVPAWRKPGGLIHLPLLEKLGSLGYNYLDLKHAPRKDLLYYREGQIVARQIIILEKATK